MKHYLKPLSLVEQTDQTVRNREAARGCVSQWVQLIVLPDVFSYDQALLIQQQSADEWLAWIPDYGEAILHRSEFYFEFEWN